MGGEGKGRLTLEFLVRFDRDGLRGYGVDYGGSRGG